MQSGIHLDATFGHQLGDVFVGERIPKIPAHAQNDHFPRILASFERIVREVTSDFPPSNESEKQEVPSGGFSETVLDIEPEEASGPGPDWPEDA